MSTDACGPTFTMPSSGSNEKKVEVKMPDKKIFFLNTLRLQFEIPYEITSSENSDTQFYA